MEQKSSVYEINYEIYRSRIGAVDFASAASTLGLVSAGDGYKIDFFGQTYFVSQDGIQDECGKTPDYMLCVILAKYLILCPDHVYLDEAWCAFRDFKKESHFLNVNYFRSDTEKVIADTFSGKIDKLEHICEQLDGQKENEGFSYDLVMRFKVLPRISLLLLFNDGDDDFEASGTVLFQKQAEYYLDPESLAMTSACLAQQLRAFEK